MNIKRITPEFPDLDKVEALALEAFPPDEYMAPAKIMELADRGEVDFWGLYDEGRFVGFLVITLFESMIYLFFLAIDPRCRSHGYGGKVLRLLNDLYPDHQQVVDFEMVDETAPNNEQRKTRRAFYLRNGFQPTGKFLTYLSVDYEILCKDDHFDFDLFRRMMETFHIDDFHPQYFER